MANIQSSDNITYKSWISLVEDAEKTIAALSQRSQLVTIDDKDNVSENRVFIFDTSHFRER